MPISVPTAWRLPALTCCTPGRSKAKPAPSGKLLCLYLLFPVGFMPNFAFKDKAYHSPHAFAAIADAVQIAVTAIAAVQAEAQL